MRAVLPACSVLPPGGPAPSYFGVLSVHLDHLPHGSFWDFPESSLLGLLPAFNYVGQSEFPGCFKGEIRKGDSSLCGYGCGGMQNVRLSVFATHEGSDTNFDRSDADCKRWFGGSWHSAARHLPLLRISLFYPSPM